MLGESYLALRDGGAWSASPDHGRRRLWVSAPTAIEGMTGTLSWRYLPEPRRGRMIQGAARLAGVWDFRCAAHQYRLIADGKMHFSVYHRLLPWDHAPGWLLHREAGGHAARFDGGAYDPLRQDGGLICAPDRESWAALENCLF